jgi:hypothetical protein
MLEKVTKIDTEPKSAVKSTSKLNLKVPNVNIELLFKLEITHNKPCFATAYLGEKEKKFTLVKEAQNVATFGGYLSFQKS